MVIKRWENVDNELQEDSGAQKVLTTHTRRNRQHSLDARDTWLPNVRNIFFGYLKGENGFLSTLGTF